MRCECRSRGQRHGGRCRVVRSRVDRCPDGDGPFDHPDGLRRGGRHHVDHPDDRPSKAGVWATTDVFEIGVCSTVASDVTLGWVLCHEGCAKYGGWVC